MRTLELDVSQKVRRVRNDQLSHPSPCPRPLSVNGGNGLIRSCASPEFTHLAYNSITHTLNSLWRMKSQIATRQTRFSNASSTVKCVLRRCAADKLRQQLESTRETAPQLGKTLCSGLSFREGGSFGGPAMETLQHACERKSNCTCSKTSNEVYKKKFS